MKRLLASILVLAATACSGGQGPVSLVVAPGLLWHPVKTGMAKADPVELVANYPDSAAARLRLLNGQIEAQDKAGALASLAWLTAHGHVFSAGGQRQLALLAANWGQPDPGLIARAKERSASEDFAKVPAAAQLVEAVAFDRGRGRLFVSTVVSRQLWVRDSTGRWSAVGLAGADSLSGMVTDPARGVLWVASGNLGMGPVPQNAFHGLIGIDLASLREVARIAAPNGVNPSDIALGRKGTLYASDPIGGGVYRARAGETTLTELIAPGTFRSPQGLAESADGRLLYVSDYGYGLAAIALDQPRVLRLGAGTALPIPLDGIDGLWRQGNSLVAVQNGTSPQRIVRLALAYGGLSIWRAEVLEQANPAWTEPTSGSLDGHRLLYVATGQWDRFDNGAPLPGKPAQPTQVRLLQLRTTNH